MSHVNNTVRLAGIVMAIRLPRAAIVTLMIPLAVEKAATPTERGKK